MVEVDAVCSFAIPAHGPSPSPTNEDRVSSATPGNTRTQLLNVSDTVWALERMNKEKALPLAERVNLLRSHYELQQLKEENLDIPKRDRSFLYLQEKPSATVLLVPGGHSTPAQYFKLGRHLYRAGMTVYCSLLPNEAAVGAQQGGVPWQLSLAELEMRYGMLELLDVPIHVVGSSFGSILCVNLAARHKMASLTLLSPPLSPSLKFSERMALTWGRLFPRLFERMVADSPHRWKADRYSAVRAASKQLRGLEAPVLALHAADNPEIGPAGIKRVAKAMGSRAKTVLMEKGGHLLLEGSESASVTKQVQEFIQSSLKDPSPSRPRD
jgi:alpha-beta hydrolase superfamily lysophospholipase